MTSSVRTPCSPGPRSPSAPHDPTPSAAPLAPAQSAGTKLLAGSTNATEPSGTPLEAAHRLNGRLLAARRAQRGAEHSLARLLAEMAGGGFRLLGYASIHQYASSALELHPRASRDLLRLGRALPQLPVMDAALASGLLDWTKARELVRVVTPETEAGWVARAQAVSGRVLDREVACTEFGAPARPPDAEPMPVDEREPLRRRLCFEMEATDAEVLFQALALLRARSDLSPAEVEDSALLAGMARTIIQLHESAAVAYTASDDAGPPLASAGPVAPGADAIAHAAAEPPEPRGSEADVNEGTGRFSERYRIVLTKCPTCRRVQRPDGDVSDTIAFEASCDAEIIDMEPGPAQGQATRKVPAVLRRRVFHRARWRCEVPNCRNRLWLDVHHTDLWSRTHTHDFEKLMVLCDAHHRAVHDGALAVEIEGNGTIRVQHGDGRRFVARRSDFLAAATRAGRGEPAPWAHSPGPT